MGGGMPGFHPGSAPSQNTHYKCTPFLAYGGHMEYRINKENAKELQKLATLKKRENAANKKKMKQTLEILLSKSLRRGELASVDDIMNLADAEDLNVDVQTAIMIATVQRALMGDMTAIQFVRDTMGEKPSDKIELDQSLTVESWAKNHKPKL